MFNKKLNIQFFADVHRKRRLLNCLNNKMLEIKEGLHGSVTLTVKKGSKLNDDIELLSSTEQKYNKGAIFISIDETDIGNNLSIILKNGYKLHRFSKDPLNNVNYVYYKWNNPTVEDKVPPYATSIGGAAVCLLSPDEKQVLLVFEYGKFKFVTGSVDCNELTMNTGVREVKEEVNLELDKSFKIRMCGGWNISGPINDVLFCYVAKATSTDFVLDKTEVSDGKWFDIEFLKEAYEKMNGYQKMVSSKMPKSEWFEYKETKLSCASLHFLHNYLQGRTYDCIMSSENKSTVLF